ncbi:GNAT family N-acetyltransferase [Gordonia insulae]|uniref:Ribosomal-protein-alanine acetyltransferase n=1 Tax=Gordonia insulae TaxID=2420509 RepID=A0A3G8JJ93_9ACTN|nr:GNAT family N-acetyltransferase [Gordonia insulae]AZG45008.1 Ribosomal-protein-alanine acetyltransferase [Gordonia insulae]
MSAAERFRVRDAVADDAVPVSELRARVAAEGRWIGMEAPVDVEGLIRNFHDVLADDSAHAVVAVDDADTVVGSAGMFTVLPGVIAFGMNVAADSRRQGAGGLLLRSVLAWSRDRGAHKVILEVWPHNEAAIGLYTAHGFVREGVRRGHYRRRNGELWDVVEMGLLLQ